MAVQVKTEEAVTRQDTLRVNPNDVARGRNSRIVNAPNYADQVRERAIDIWQNGQLQPAEARRDTDKSLILTFGFTRLDAVLLLREGFDATIGDETFRVHDANARLWVRVVDATEEEAFDRGVAENRQRNDTTDLQEAKAHEYYRTSRGFNDTEIARVYGYTNQNRVMNLKKLLTLSESIQGLVHEGKLSLSAAIDSLKLPEETREETIKAATTETGKVDGAAIRSTVRTQQLEKTDDDEGDRAASAGTSLAGPRSLQADKDPGEEPKKYQKATVKDFNNFVSDFKNNVDSSDKAKELLSVLVLWFEGKRTDKYLTGKIDELCK